MAIVCWLVLQCDESIYQKLPMIVINSMLMPYSNVNLSYDVLLAE